MSQFNKPWNWRPPGHNKQGEPRDNEAGEPLQTDLGRLYGAHYASRYSVKFSRGPNPTSKRSGH